MRVKVILECSICRRRNYVSRKNKQLHPERVEQKKFCKGCGKRTLHKETR